MLLAVELEREEDGRWIAEIDHLPGTLAYGPTPDEAIRAVRALALRVIADRIEHGGARNAGAGSGHEEAA